MKNILFIASEAVPFIKTGGLADVVGSLPKCFDKQYFDVRVMIPKYLCIKESFRNEMKYVNHFYMDYLGQNRVSVQGMFARFQTRPAKAPILNPLINNYCL